jgi:hypothetical protein
MCHRQAPECHTSSYDQVSADAKPLTETDIKRHSQQESICCLMRLLGNIKGQDSQIHLLSSAGAVCAGVQLHSLRPVAGGQGLGAAAGRGLEGGRSQGRSICSPRTGGWAQVRESPRSV